MIDLERGLLDLLLRVVPIETLSAALRDPQTVAILLGGLIAVSGALLGVFLLLRGMAMTSDAISHTVLLGIVVAFLTAGALGVAIDLGSPLLIVGAAAAGVGTVALTEALYRTGRVKQDAALGLAFPFLFALAVILVSRFVDNVHLDTDSVMVGEIGIAWADATPHCYAGCENVTITPDDPRAQTARTCTNCRALGIPPRHPDAVFSETCVNCGTFSPGEAYAAGLIAAPPQIVFFPRALGVMGLLTLLVLAFVIVFYKELKLTTFDAALARALGFRPGVMHYALMVLVSLVAVGGFSAVGSILMVAFFILPAATAYLLTRRLGLMLLIAPLLGMAAAYFGYGLARGSVFGLFDLGAAFALVNRVLGTALPEVWNSSISASMVIVLLLLFIAAWVGAPADGLIAGVVRRLRQRGRFIDMALMGHIVNHEMADDAEEELALSTLHTHLGWGEATTRAALARLRARGWVEVRGGRVALTPPGRTALSDFLHAALPHRAPAG
jgi:ABC-type Mn2+/Zn2+ transport system permease subunit